MKRILVIMLSCITLCSENSNINFFPQMDARGILVLQKPADMLFFR